MCPQGPHLWTHLWAFEWIVRYAAFGHHLLEITIGDAVAAIPSQASAPGMGMFCVEPLIESEADALATAVMRSWRLSAWCKHGANSETCVAVHPLTGHDAARQGIDQWTHQCCDLADHDGPFAETRELVAGYWLWEVKAMTLRPGPSNATRLP